MGRFTRIALSALLVSIAVAPHASAQQELTFSLFERYLDALRVQTNIPGMSATIVQNEKVVWDTGLGFADVEHAVRARSDTPYHIADLTETLSSALLLRGCVEAGRISSLDSRIQQFLPSFQDASITVRDALIHRSGSGSFKFDPSRFAVLTGVAEACIQKTGLPFRQAVFERLFYPLNMFDSVPAQNVDDESADDRAQFDSSNLDRFGDVLKRLARPYRISGGSPTLNSSVSKNIDAATGAISTVRDLAKFDAALDGGLLRSDTTATMWSNQSGMPTGLGWFVQNYNGRTIYWQFGNTPGAYSSLILKVPSQRLTLILLANSDGLSAPFPLQNGDVTTSLFAKTFLRLFVG